MCHPLAVQQSQKPTIYIKVCSVKIIITLWLSIHKSLRANKKNIILLPGSAEFPNCREILLEVLETCEPNRQNIHPAHSVKKKKIIFKYVTLLKA